MADSGIFVKRLTFFKIPKEEDIDKVLKEYETLRKNAVKVIRPLGRRVLKSTADSCARTASHI